MKKVICMLGMVVCLSGLSGIGGTVTVKAVTIDEVIREQGNAVGQVVGNGGGNTDTANNVNDNSANFANDMRKSADLSNSTLDTSKVTVPIQQWASWLVKVLSIILFSLLAVMTVLELLYMNVPLTRGLLDGGKTVSSGGNGYNGSSNSGYGMGDSYGMGSSSSGYGGSSGSSSSSGKRCIVSETAIKTVQQFEGEGRIAMLKCYFKDMIIMYTVIPVILIMGVTGIAVDVGFWIAGLLENMIRGIVG